MNVKTIEIYKAPKSLKKLGKGILLQKNYMVNQFKRKYSILKNSMEDAPKNHRRSILTR